MRVRTETVVPRSIDAIRCCSQDISCGFIVSKTSQGKRIKTHKSLVDKQLHTSTLTDVLSASPFIANCCGIPCILPAGMDLLENPRNVVHAGRCPAQHRHRPINGARAWDEPAVSCFTPRGANQKPVRDGATGRADGSLLLRAAGRLWASQFPFVLCSGAGAASSP